MTTRLFRALRRIWYAIPFRIRFRVGTILFFPYDMLRRDRGKRPPWMRIFVGTGDFDAIGRSVVDSLVTFGLTPKSHFLDVGSGLGRIALPLTEHLDPAAHYAGFDVVPEFVDWCRDNITSRHPNFTFHLIDAGNSEYNPGGEVDAASVRFPFPDATFDFVYLGSVFTHLLPPAVENYVREIARVMRRGGTCVATFFLLNDQSRALVDSGRAHMPLIHEMEGCRVLDPKNPEADVAHNESAIQTVFEGAGLEVTETLYGSWCGRSQYRDYQDIIVARR